MAQDALQGLRNEEAMIRNRDVALAFAQADVRAVLSGDGEAESAQRSDGVATRNVAGKFHAVAKTGSLTKCSRMVRGALPLPK